MPPEPSVLENILRSEWAAISVAPFSFCAAILFGLFLGWVVLRLWYGRSFKIEKAKLSFVEAQLDIERKQKEGLRAAILDLKPKEPVMALEISHGDPEIREVVVALAEGETIRTPVDPSRLRADFSRTIWLKAEDIKTIAQLDYTSANNLSQTIVTGTVASSSATPALKEIKGFLETTEQLSALGRAIEAIKAEPQMSDRAIAAKIGVTETTVRRARAKMRAEPQDKARFADKK